MHRDSRSSRWLMLLLPLLLTACGSLTPRDSGPRRPVDVSSVSEPVPRSEPRSKYGNPASYEVHGRTYRVLSSSRGYVERGIASWYGTKFHGGRTSSGETYDMYKMSAAHKTLPIPCHARVTNLENGRSVIVRINDRGPFHDNRLIDLSYAAAMRLGINGKGTGLVEVRVVDGAEETTAIAPALAATNSESTPQIYLQAGAFVSRSNAEQLRSRLAAGRIPYTTLQEASRAEGAIYRVRIGPLQSVDEADQLTTRIESLGIDTPQVVID